MKRLNDIVYRTSFISILVNIFLSIFKLIAGIIGNSAAMISDAIHSSSDVISTFVVIIGVFASRKKPDKKHQYGHDRYECIAGIILAFILTLTGFYIGYNGIMNLINKHYQTQTVSVIALIAAIVSIITKEWMYHYTIRASKKVDCTALKADAWHHRSDALSSIGAMIGIFGSLIGFKFLDPIAAIIISLCIVKASFDIMKDAFDKMMDCSVDDEIEKEILYIVKSITGVLRIDDIKTRMFADKIYIDLEISIDGNLTLNDAHDIVEQVHDKVEKNIKKCKHCMIHVNPY